MVGGNMEEYQAVVIPQQSHLTRSNGRQSNQPSSNILTHPLNEGKPEEKGTGRA